MFFWSLFGVLDSLLFIIGLYLVYTYGLNKDLPMWLKGIIGLLLLPVIVLTPTNYNLASFDLTSCSANDNLFFNYTVYLKIIVSLLIIGIIFYRYKTTQKDKLKPVMLMVIGTILFLLSIFTSEYISDHFDMYVISVYGIFVVTLFMAFLAYLIVKFKAFNIKLIGAQALVWALIILIGSQFTYYNQMPLYSLIITGITLILSAVMGLLIVRSVKKEVKLREELEIANTNQESLIHFVSHQLKGFFTKSKMIFAGIIEEDFGQSSETLKGVAREGLLSDNNAVSMIQDILGASNYKKGTIAYTMKDVDLTEIIKDICDGFTKEISDKGLELKKNISDVPMNVLADRTQIIQVFKNLIDNSIKYTQAGNITVSLEKISSGNKEKAFFKLSDTGVGLSSKDKDKLFTEGGKGEDSLKYNTNSTGYGLYIVKKIVENHGGKIWAESEGRGKGSQFFVELDLVK